VAADGKQFQAFILVQKGIMRDANDESAFEHFTGRALYDRQHHAEMRSAYMAWGAEKEAFSLDATVRAVIATRYPECSVLEAGFMPCYKSCASNSIC
jgi:hypothetical protein